MAVSSWNTLILLINFVILVYNLRLLVPFFFYLLKKKILVWSLLHARFYSRGAWPKESRSQERVGDDSLRNGDEDEHVRTGPRENPLLSSCLHQI